MAENILDGFQMVLAVGGNANRVALLQRNLRVGILQVKALMDLLERLIDGVADLLHVHLADDVE